MDPLFCNPSIKERLRFYRDSVRQSRYCLEDETTKLSTLKNSSFGYMKNRPMSKEVQELSIKYAETQVSFWKERLNNHSIKLRNNLDISRVISEICVVKNLPAGDPCWMSRMISSYL